MPITQAQQRDYGSNGRSSGGDINLDNPPFNMEEFDNKRRTAMGKVVGTFLVLVIALLAVSLATDTIESKKSQKMLDREANWKPPEVKPLAPKKAGGIKALDKFATKIMNLGAVGNSTTTKGPAVVKRGQTSKQSLPTQGSKPEPPTRSRTGE